MNTVPLLEHHNERQNKNYSNKDIDLSLSSENFHLKKIEAATNQQEFERIRQRYDLKGNLRLSGEKQSNVMCEFVITSDKEFFDRLGVEKFFADAYNFVTAKSGITTRGYDLERGVKGSTAEHLSVVEFKLKKTEEQFTEIANQISEVERVDEIKSAIEFLLRKFYIYRKALRFHTENGRKNISLRAEYQSLRNKNEEPRSENDRISNQLHTLEYRFDEFYSSVEDEIALRDENIKLKSENSRIGNQVCTLKAEIIAFKEEN